MGGEVDPDEPIDSRSWVVNRRFGTASHLHDESARLINSIKASDQDERPRPVRRCVRVLTSIDDAVVLGSAQPLDHIDATRLEAAGLSVARRRSGGGAVLVGPDEILWVDLVIPAVDQLWDADVGRAAWWVGEAWVGALGDIGTVEARTWRGGMQNSAWSRYVCFGGMGPGEVAVADKKTVGISQRRTRSGILFQCAVLLRWDPARLVDVLKLTAGERDGATAELNSVAAGIGPHGEALLSAFLRRLPF